MAQLSPLIMMAAEGLLDPGVDAVVTNPDLQAAISAYSAQSILGSFSSTYAALDADAYDGTLNPYGISPSVIVAFKTTLDSTAPFLTGRVPASAGLTTSSFLTFLNKQIANLMDSDEEYCLIVQAASGYVQIANSWVNSAVNAADIGSQTFTDMDNLMSGNIAILNTDMPTFGQDLLNTGTIYDFKRLEVLGTPQMIMEALVLNGALSNIADELAGQGIDYAQLESGILDNPTRILKPVAQKRCYNALQAVTGQKLDEILTILSVVTQGLESAADLLNPVKVFPNSYETLTSLNNGVVDNIYNNGSISTWVSQLYSEFASAIPADIARANAAFVIALHQIKGLCDSNPTAIGNAALTMERNTGLSNINALTTAMPAATTTFLQNAIGGGSGPDDTYYLTDFVGTPTGVPHLDNLTTVNTAIAGLTLGYLLSILQTASEVAGGLHDLNPGTSGEVDIPVGLPAEGYWATHDAAIAALDAALDLEVSSFSVSAATAAYLNSVDHIKREIASLQKANVEFLETYYINTTLGLDGLNPSQSSTMSFAENLHQYGTKTNKHDIAEVLDKVANRAEQAGEAIIGAMREGRNLAKIRDAGVTADNIASDQPKTVEPGDIS